MIDEHRTVLRTVGPMFLLARTEDTALHLYGPSAEVMRARLTDLLASRPDMQLSRLESIT